MEVGQRWVRCYSYLFHFRYNLRCGWRLRRPFPQCVSQALLGELILRNPDELLESKNFGVTSLNEVRAKLSDLGLRLRND